MLKKILTILVMGFCLNLGWAANGYAVGETYLIAGGEASLRIGPSLESDIKKRLPVKIKVKSLEQQGEWHRVINLMDGDIGWVRQENLELYLPPRTKIDIEAESKLKNKVDLPADAKGNSLKIINYNFQSKSPSLLELFGEVKNLTELECSEIRIKFKVMGFDNRILKIDGADLDPRNLDAGETGTFTKIISKSSNLSYVVLTASWMVKGQEMRSREEIRIDIPLEETAQSQSSSQDRAKTNLHEEIDELESYINRNAEALSASELDDLMDRLKSAQISLLTSLRNNLTNEYLQKVEDKVRLLTLLKEKLPEANLRRR